MDSMQEFQIQCMLRKGIDFYWSTNKRNLFIMKFKSALHELAIVIAFVPWIFFYSSNAQQVTHLLLKLPKGSDLNAPHVKVLHAYGRYFFF